MNDKEFYQVLHERLAEKFGLTTQQIPHLRNLFIGFGMTKNEVITHFVENLDKTLKPSPSAKRARIDAGKEYDPSNHRTHPRPYYIEMIKWLLTADAEMIAELTIEPRKNKPTRERIVDILRGVEKATKANRPPSEKTYLKMAGQILDAVRKEKYI